MCIVTLFEFPTEWIFYGNALVSWLEQTIITNIGEVKLFLPLKWIK